MSKRNKRKSKPSGHPCWACGRRRPNEKFSGGGHRRHLCRDCAKLGAEELARRQAMLNLGRCVTWEGIIPKKQRKSFEKFLSHEHPQIRALAEELQEEDRTVQRQMRAEAELEEACVEFDEPYLEPDDETGIAEIRF